MNKVSYVLTVKKMNEDEVTMGVFENYPTENQIKKALQGSWYGELLEFCCREFMNILIGHGKVHAGRNASENTKFEIVKTRS